MQQARPGVVQQEEIDLSIVVVVTGNGAQPASRAEAALRNSDTKLRRGGGVGKTSAVVPVQVHRCSVQRQQVLVAIPVDIKEHETATWRRRLVARRTREYGRRRIGERDAR